MKKINGLLSSLLLTALSLNLSFAEKIMEVTIEGISNKKALENAQNAAEIYALNGKEAPSDLRIQWLYQEGAKEIANALQPYGYYRADVKGDLIYQKETIIAKYDVTLNKAIPIGALILGITDLAAVKARDTDQSEKEYQAFSSILEKTKLKVDAPLNHTQYESTKGKLSQKASELGYFDAFYPHHELIVNLDKYQAEINLQMTLGERYRFGSSTFHQEYFAPEFLERFLHNMREENDYSDQKLVELQSTFNETNYFEDVVIVPKTNATTKEVPLDIYLRPRKQRTMTLGAGYSSDIGFKVMGGLDWHYFNKYGHKLSTNVLWAQKKRDATINYRIPGSDPTQDQYNIYFNYDFEDTDTKDYTTYLVGVSKDRVREQYSYGYSLHYQYDRFRDIRGDKQNGKLLVPSIYGEWKTASTIPFNEFGLKIEGKLRGSINAGLSDITFLQSLGAIYGYIPITDTNRLVLRGSLGHTKISSKDLPKLPPSLRFYTGGDTTVRGYKYDGIGDKDYRGDIYGGKKLVIASLEYEHRITPSFSAVAFVDAGDAFNSKVDLKYGAGAGMRWYSPIGTVKFDLAHGFDKEFGDRVRLHLTIGTDL